MKTILLSQEFYAIITLIIVPLITYLAVKLNFTKGANRSTQRH